MERLFSALSWAARAEDTGCPNVRVFSVPAEARGLEEIGDSADLTILNLLKEGGAQGFKSENSLWTILWTFLYWDVIFDKRPGAYDERMGTAFPSENQDIPHDLFTEDFHPPRREMFEARRAELAGKGLKQAFEASFAKNSTKPTRLLESLPYLDPGDLSLALEVVPVEPGLKVLDRLSKDYNTNRSGLPDLFVYTDKLMLVEVKGPTDSIKANQIDWLRYLGGFCGFEVGVLTVGWSDRKLSNLRSKLEGPKGVLTVSYGASSSKYFKDIEEAVSAWDKVERVGEGKNLKVTADLSLSRITEAGPIVEKIARWKGASASIDGEPAAMSADSALRCLIKKESQFAGRSYCARGDYKRFGCHRFKHWALIHNRFDEYGYRDSERGVFVVDKAKLESESQELIAALEVCPHFSEKTIHRELEKIPAEVNPETDKEWAWVDDSYSTWVFDGGQWQNSYGDSEFPGVAKMVKVERLTSRDRRSFLNSAREWKSMQEPITIRVGPPTKKQGCSLILAALLGLGVLSGLLLA